MKKITKLLFTSLFAIILAGCETIPNVESLTIKQTVKPSLKLNIKDEQEKEVLELFYNKYKKNVKKASTSMITGLSKSFSINYKVKDDNFTIIIFEDNFGLLTKQGDESKVIKFYDGVYASIKEYFDNSQDKEMNKISMEDFKNKIDELDKESFFNTIK